MNLENVKAGDKIIVVNSDIGSDMYVREVTRTTKTRISVKVYPSNEISESSSIKTFNRATGGEIGGGRFAYCYILPMTEDNLKAIEENKLLHIRRQKINKLREVRWESLTDEAVNSIFSIIEKEIGRDSNGN